MRDFKAYFEEYNRSDPTVADPAFDATFRKRVKWLARQLSSGVRVLEFGCGEGVVLAALSERVALDSGSCGVDLSENAVRKAAARFPTLHFVPTKADGTIPFGAASFDVIVTSEVIDYVYDSEGLFEEFARVLKTGGRLLVTTTYHGFLKTLVLLASGRTERHYHDPRGGKLRHYSRASLASILRDHGFRIVSWAGIGRIPYVWKTMAVASVQDQHRHSA